jgi:hypothetical protein
MRCRTISMPRAPLPCAEIACRLESVVELRHALVPTVVLGLRVSTSQPGLGHRSAVPDHDRRAGSRAFGCGAGPGSRGSTAKTAGDARASPSALVGAGERERSRVRPPVQTSISRSPSASTSTSRCTKYMHGSDADAIPLRLQFSGMNLLPRRAGTATARARSRDHRGRRPVASFASWQSLRDRATIPTAQAAVAASDLRQAAALTSTARACLRGKARSTASSTPADEANRITERARDEAGRRGSRAATLYDGYLLHPYRPPQGEDRAELDGRRTPAARSIAT